MFEWLKSIVKPEAGKSSPSPANEPKLTLTPDTVLRDVHEGRAVLIDVREPAEWNQLHCDYSSSLPLSRIRTLKSKEEIRELIPEGCVIYLHCVMGKRARQAESMLKDLGLNPLAWDISLKELVACARSRT